MEKRKPLLADGFMRFGATGLRVIESRTIKLTQQRLHVARKFRFDDDAIRRTAGVIRDIPELILRESRFARAPYDVTWIEMDNFPLYWQTMHPDRLMEPTFDLRLGFLIDHDFVYVISGGTGKNPEAHPILLPISYALHTPWSFDRRQVFAEQTGTTLLELEALLWGSTIRSLGKITDIQHALTSSEHPLAAIRNYHSVRLLPMIRTFDQTQMRKFLRESVGELRLLIAMLLLLNRPTVTIFGNETPSVKTFLKGKRHTYFAYNVVTINLDPTPTLLKIGTVEGDAIARRRHEVRGTWCDNYNAREYKKIGCIHEWRNDPEYVGVDDPNDPDHFVCKVCEGKRWWREDHMRGDASVGFVVKEYEVTHRERRRQLFKEKDSE